MINSIQLKVCGLTSIRDAEAAARAGADFLGFNLYPKSPRHIALPEFRKLASALPKPKRVAVMVEPSDADLEEAADAGFDLFQIHFRHDAPLERLQGWSQKAGRNRLWLAPKLPPSTEIPESWMPLADFFLLDTFSPEIFGGTGRTGDWGKFSRAQAAHPDKSWILSGGLNPANIADALRQSGARMIDINSGVESAPGIKDHGKLTAFAAALRGGEAGA